MQAGDSRLGAKQGEKKITLFLEICDVDMTAVADTSYCTLYYPRAEQGPKSSILHCENSHGDKSLESPNEPKTAQKATPAHYETCETAAASPHQTG